MDNGRHGPQGGPTEEPESMHPNPNPDSLRSAIDAAHFSNAALYAALDKILASETHLTRTLEAQGLSCPSCAPVYRAVFSATLNAELAWEAARHQQLLWLRNIQKGHAERYASMRSDVYAYTVDDRRVRESELERAQHIAGVAQMPNPFAPAAQALSGGAR
jgi:hypothetical protein